MKTLFFLIFSISGIFTSVLVSAQESDSIPKSAPPPYYYLYYGGGKPTGYITTGGGLTYIHTNYWGISCGTQLFLCKSKELPSDYDPGLTILDFHDPSDQLITFALRAVREFKGPSVFLRFGIEAGPALIIYRRNHFTFDPNHGVFDSNYIRTESKMYIAGLSFRARTDLPFTRFFGAQIALIGNLNAHEPYGGIELNFDLGLIRERSQKEIERQMK